MVRQDDPHGGDAARDRGGDEPAGHVENQHGGHGREGNLHEVDGQRVAADQAESAATRVDNPSS